MVSTPSTKPCRSHTATAQPLLKIVDNTDLRKSMALFGPDPHARSSRARLPETCPGTRLLALCLSLSLCPPIHVSIYLSVCLSIYLSLSLHTKDDLGVREAQLRSGVSPSSLVGIQILLWKMQLPADGPECITCRDVCTSSAGQAYVRRLFLLSPRAASQLLHKPNNRHFQWCHTKGTQKNRAWFRAAYRACCQHAKIRVLLVIASGVLNANPKILASQFPRPKGTLKRTRKGCGLPD